MACDDQAGSTRGTGAGPGSGQQERGVRVLTFRKDILERKEWHAHWIHAGVAGKGPWYCFFRTEIVVERPLRRATLDITADRHYRLSIDGRETGEGPARSNRHYWSYDTYEPSLPEGAHALGVVVSQWDPSPDRDLALLCQLNLEYEDGSCAIVGTGTSWRTRVAQGWCHDVPAVIWIGPLQNGYVEVRDLRRDDMDWLLPGYDDSGWERARTFERDVNINPYPIKHVGRHWEFLTPRDIPFLENRVVRPLSVCATGEIRDDEIFCNRSLIGPHLWNGLAELAPVRKTTVEGAEELLAGRGPLVLGICHEGDSFGRNAWQPAVVFDFGKLVNAHILVCVEGPAGSVVDLSYSQTLQDGKVHPYTGGIYRVARFVLGEGRQELATFEYVNCRFVQLTLREASAPVQVHAITLKTVEYPMEQRGRFTCSDPLLNRVWQATADTVRLCTTDLFMDNTWREKNGWGGDVSVILLSAFACFGELAVMRRYLRMFIADQAPSGAIPGTVPSSDTATGLIDHSMAIPLRIRDYYLLTGDTDFVRELYPGVRRFMEYLERYEEADGILGEVPGLVWFEWSSIDRRLPSATLTLYYALTLEAAATLSEAARAEEDSLTYQAKLAAIRNRVDAFWNQGRSAVADCLVNGRPSSTVSEATNGIALLTGWLSDGQMSSVVEHVFNGDLGILAQRDVTQSSPPIALYVLQGLCRAGRHDRALAYIRKRHGSAFDQGLETMPEAWIFSSRGETSAAQGTLPAAYVLSTEILGIKPADPGFATVAIEPHPADLSWAKGAVPTPQGVVTVQWERLPDAFTLTVSIPAGARAQVVMPYGGDHIEVRPSAGSPPAGWEVRPAEGGDRVSLPPGTYALSLARPRYNAGQR